MMRLGTFILSQHEGRVRLSQVGPCFSRRRGSHDQACLVARPTRWGLFPSTMRIGLTGAGERDRGRSRTVL